MHKLKSGILATLSLLALQAGADAPALINYQGRLLQGTNLVNGTVGLTLRLYDTASGGTLLYADSNSVTVVDGLYSTALGDGTIAGSMDAAITNQEVWLEAVVNGVILSPRERVASAAYALAVDGVRMAPNGGVAINSRLGGNAVNTDASHATIGGGVGNRIDASADGSVIAGGMSNTVFATRTNSFIGGGSSHTVYAGYSFIGSGRGNNVQGDFGFAGGGSDLTIGYLCTYGVVVGGFDNNILGTAVSYATIGGGYQNLIKNDSSHGSILGGRANMLSNGMHAVIAGGSENQALGLWATVPGGYLNKAGQQSFAAGTFAQALDTGSFVWSDAQGGTFTTTATNQFLIRASGGVGINTNNPQAPPACRGRCHHRGAGHRPAHRLRAGGAGQHRRHAFLPSWRRIYPIVEHQRNADRIEQCGHLRRHSH